MDIASINAYIHTVLYCYTYLWQCHERPFVRQRSYRRVTRYRNPLANDRRCMHVQQWWHAGVCGGIDLVAVAPLQCWSSVTLTGTTGTLYLIANTEALPRILSDLQFLVPWGYNTSPFISHKERSILTLFTYFVIGNRS